MPSLIVEIFFTLSNSLSRPFSGVRPCRLLSNQVQAFGKPLEYQAECSTVFASHSEMVDSKGRWESRKAKKRQQSEEFHNLLEVLAADTDFVTAIKASDSNVSVKDLEIMIHNHLTTLHYTSLSLSLSFRDLQSRILLIDVSNADPMIQELHLAFQSHSQNSSRKKRRQNASHRIGFTHTIGSFHNLRVILMRRLPPSQIYPPVDYIVLEGSGPEPEPLVNKDTSCKQPAQFHRLDESRLNRTIGANESVVVIDEDTREIVAIVIRNFAKSSFSIIKNWATKLIRNTVCRRRKSQRNGKGILVLFGTSTGPRHNKIVGWVRNLEDRWLKSTDRNQHDTELSSLFGLFYSLVRAQISPDIVNCFENTIQGSNLPRIDFCGNNEFTIPFDLPLHFSAYEMAPPEGYAAVDYIKEIHSDKHFEGCPWGVYWNICRDQPQNEIGIESGANFFIADYGLRIVNSENVCVTWNIEMQHGTSWYHNELSHVGLAFILGRDLEKTWNRRQQGQKGPTRFEKGLLIVDASNSEVDSESNE